MRDCRDCPAYLEVANDIGQRLGRFAGAPVCGRYGHLLGQPGDTDGKSSESVQIRRHYAMDCESYGEVWASEEKTQRIPANSHVTRVAMPTRGEGDPKHHEKLKGCGTCLHFHPATEVVKETNLTVPVCEARGTLIYDVIGAAQGCEWAKAGIPADHPTLRLLKPYQPGFKVSDKVQAATYTVATGVDIDPREYKTDYPVTPEDEAMGIRAWRKIEDVESGNTVPLPIFREDIFTEEERANIPQAGDEQHPELYVDYSGLLYEDAVVTWHLDKILCLVGQPGLGKTELVRCAAWMMQMPFELISFDKSSEKDDFVGYKEMEPERGTFWVNGRFVVAFGRPYRALLDELNLARGDTRQFMRPAFASHELTIDANHGEKIKRDPRQRFTVAINPAYDPMNLGTEELAGPELSRMNFSKVVYPPEEVERHIIRERCKVVDGYDVTDDTLNTIIGIATDFRAANEEGALPMSWGIREQIDVARLTRFFTTKKAYDVAFLNYVDPATRDEAIVHIENHVR